jgi:hypothetical protein
MGLGGDDGFQPVLSAQEEIEDFGINYNLSPRNNPDVPGVFQGVLAEKNPTEPARARDLWAWDHELFGDPWLESYDARGYR